jgi:hypothetical protein
MTHSAEVFTLDRVTFQNESLIEQVQKLVTNARVCLKRDEDTRDCWFCTSILSIMNWLIGCACQYAPGGWLRPTN